MAERKVSSIVCFDNLTSMLGITMCISTNRTVYSFGKHSRGAHGHRENEVRIPKEINSLQAICNIDCGSFHAICLNDEGRVFTFGDNSYGQLGVSKVVTPFCYGPQDYNILQLPIIRQISAGSFYNVCLSVDNEVYSFGQNNCGQLGTGDFTDYNYPQKISTVLVESNEVNGEYTVSDIDMLASLLTGDSCNSTTCVEKESNLEKNSHAKSISNVIEYRVSKGLNYFLVIGGTNGYSGEFILNIDFTPDGPSSSSTPSLSTTPSLSPTPSKSLSITSTESISNSISVTPTISPISESPSISNTPSISLTSSKSTSVIIPINSNPEGPIDSDEYTFTYPLFSYSDYDDDEIVVPIPSDSSIPSISRFFEDNSETIDKSNSSSIFISLGIVLTIVLLLI